MMSLCYGKVTADTARLALATQVIQVNHIPTSSVPPLLYYYYYSQWKYFQSRIYQVIAVLLIC